jgi:hypothetical protein
MMHSIRESVLPFVAVGPRLRAVIGKVFEA